MNKTFGVIGGDRRQAELARLLAEEGRTVWTSGVAGCPDLPAQAAAADVVILPLPLCREDGLLNSETEDLPTSALFRRFSPGQLLLAGQVRPAQQIEAENCGLTLVDYFQREELTVANAAATAESALQIAMEHLDRTLLGMECLVLGFGRIGKLLAYRLHGLGAHVTVTARKPADLAWIRAYGWQALETGRLDGALCEMCIRDSLMPRQILQPLHQVIRGPEAGIREGGDLRRDRDDCLIQLHQLLQLRQHLFMGAEGAAHRKSDPFFSHTGSPRSFKM